MLSSSASHLPILCQFTLLLILIKNWLEFLTESIQRITNSVTTLLLNIPSASLYRPSKMHFMMHYSIIGIRTNQNACRKIKLDPFLTSFQMWIVIDKNIKLKYPSLEKKYFWGKRLFKSLQKQLNRFDHINFLNCLKQEQQK